LTPDQLEEFEAVFLHFDRERSNSLGNVEFGAALASLGLNYEPDEMEEIFQEVSNGKGRVNFEQFIRFMVTTWRRD
jgi:Ca2+-binding EF-hand superfamily protein